jgi:hypothetical protein
MRNSEPNMYAGLAIIRNGYMQMQWSRAQMYLVFNTVALPLVFKPETEYLVRFVLCLIALAVCVFLPVAMYGAHKWTNFYNGKMAEMERLDLGQDAEPRVKVFSDDRFGLMTNRKLASRYTFSAFAGILTIVWSVEAVRSGLIVFPAVLQWLFG